MDKQESLKELRDRVLKIFGESLDEYIREKEEFAKSINNLGTIKAKLFEEVKILTDQKAKLISDSNNVVDAIQKAKKEIATRGEEFRKSIQEDRAKLDREKIEYENTVKTREKSLDEAKLSIGEREDKLTGDMILANNQAGLLRARELALEKGTQNNSKWGNDLAQKESELKMLEAELNGKLSKAKELDEKLNDLIARENKIKVQEDKTEIDMKKANSKIEELDILSRKLSSQQLAQEDKERTLNSREIWLDDRVKTMRTHTV